MVYFVTILLLFLIKFIFKYRNSSKNIKSTQRPSSVTNLNAKLIEQKKENLQSLKLENNELKTLNKTSEIERMRLMELVKTLQKRIEELNEKSMENENKLNEIRRRSAVLEKQLEKSKIQDSKNPSIYKTIFLSWSINFTLVLPLKRCK